jgi:site-specific recombinase XerD
MLQWERRRTMANTHVIGPVVRRFLLEDVGVDRNLSVNTQRSYRDTLRLLFRFMTERYATEPTQMTVEHLTADVIKSFLIYLEEERGNAIDTRNLRLTALHSLFRFVARQIPELIEQATQIQTIPLRRTTQPTVTYLEKDEIDALLAMPDRSSLQGQRDYALLLFLYNTGARASEAAHTHVGALHLDTLLPRSGSLAKDARYGSAPFGLTRSTSCEAFLVQDLKGLRICRCSLTFAASKSLVSAFIL